MMKKIAVLLLSLSLLATFLTACAQQNAAENEPPVNDVSDNETSEDNTSQEEGIDLTILYEADDDIQIVKTKKFAVKPMDPEEACVQMELLGHNFYVFLNSETEQVNVVYKRKGNTYGLIEPEF